MSFLDLVSEELNDEYKKTENGALGYNSSKKHLLDLNFSVSSMRSWTEIKIKQQFALAYNENYILATKWLFYLRDIRAKGMGERRTFRILMNWLAKTNPNEAKKLIFLIAEYGRFDDIFCLLDTEVEDDVYDYIKTSLNKDIKALENEENISLLAKWLPSCNASSSKTKELARKICKKLGYTEEEYRKILSSLRKKLDLVECKASANMWDLIDYNSVPSRANLKYRKAFIKNDSKRRLAFLESLKKGDPNVKINSSTVYPSDIVAKYVNVRGWSYTMNDKDDTLEEIWKALPDYTLGDSNTLVIRDGSASMLSNVSGDSNITALDISTALAIYFAEHNKGEFHNKFMTFSAKPEMVDLSPATSLQEKVEICYSHSDYTNTDIKALFGLLLDVACKNKLKQSDMPSNLLIISDMEFDQGVTSSIPLFEEIRILYQTKGYKIPRLIFWNVCSRTMTIPMRENEMGMALVSGFSPAVYNMVLSNELDPYKALLNEINAKRYDMVEEALKN